MKQAIVYWKTLKADFLTERDEGYSFAYDKDYLTMPEAQGISLTMPLREEPFQSITLHPFFDGLIPEDTEELALTLCGKKRKLTHQHFLEAMTASGLDEKVCDNIFARFQRILPEWETCIRQSFLPGEMQRQYIEFILLKFSQI